MAAVRARYFRLRLTANATATISAAPLKTGDTPVRGTHLLDAADEHRQ